MSNEMIRLAVVNTCAWLQPGQSYWLSEMEVFISYHRGYFGVLKYEVNGTEFNSVREIIEHLSK